MSIEMNGTRKLSFTLRIKKWGVPIITFNAMREMRVPLIAWTLFPYFCYKVLMGLDKKGCALDATTGN